MIKQGLPVIHPGEYLNETLGELKISQAGFARAIGVSPMRISHVIKGTRPITAELALLIGRAFGQSPQYWLNLQTAYDLKIAEASLGELLNGVHLGPVNTIFVRISGWKYPHRNLNSSKIYCLYNGVMSFSRI